MLDISMEMEELSPKESMPSNIGSNKSSEIKEASQSDYKVEQSCNSDDKELTLATANDKKTSTVENTVNLCEIEAKQSTESSGISSTQTDCLGNGKNVESKCTSESSSSCEGDSIPDPPLINMKEHPATESICSVIPLRMQNGFRNINVGITSIDSEDIYMTFGTDAGCGFLYNRETGDLMKISSEAKNDSISVVKLFVGIECQCALGTTDGKVVIAIVTSGSAPNTRQVQKFSLGNVHQSQITCMEWSTNGMKLFSGDSTGNVYVIERDFEKNECHASLVLEEPSGVVDISYKHMILLISTLERSVLFYTNRSEDQKVPIGSKTRQGVFGACFSPDSVTASDLLIYCARPGYRIWIADINGKVKKTLLFKDLVKSCRPHIKLADPPPEAAGEDHQFRKLAFFQDQYLLAHSDTSLYLIDPTTPSILTSCDNLFGTLNVSLTRNEIFVLSKNRILRRISETADEIAIKRKRLEEEKKNEASKAFKDVKDSISGVRKNFSPLVGAFQIKKTTINEKAGQWSQKLQTQAKVLQQKLPTIGTSLFSREEKKAAPTPPSEVAEQDSPDENKNLEKDTTNQIHMKTIPLHPSPKASSSESVDGEGKETDSRKSSCDIEPQKQDSQEHSEGLEEKSQIPSSGSSSSVNFHFEKIEEIGNQETDEIVFQSKRKRSKSRTGAGRQHSARSQSNQSSPKSNPTEQENDFKDTSKDPENNIERNLPHDMTASVISDKPETKTPNSTANLNLTPDCETNPTETPANEPQIKTPDSPIVDAPPSQISKHSTTTEQTSNHEQQSPTVPLPTETQNLNGHPIKIEDRLSPDSDDPVGNHGNEVHCIPPPDVSEAPSIPPLYVNEKNDCKLKMKDQQKTEHDTGPLPTIPLSGTSPTINHPKTNAFHENLPDNEPIESGSVEIPVKIFPKKKFPAKLAASPALDCTQEMDSLDLSISSSLDDIYAVDTATRDFESELESDEFDFEDSKQNPTVTSKTTTKTETPTSVSHKSFKDSSSVPAKLLDSWSTMSLPHQATSISAADNFVWYIDNFLNIYLTEEYGGNSSAAIKWKKLAKKGMKLCISASGDIMWLIDRSGTVHAAVMPVEVHLLEEPLKFYWEKVTSGITCAALGHGSAWVVTKSGIIKSQLDLSRSRPFAKSWNLVTWKNEKVIDIAVTKSMVWCQTEQGCLYACDIEMAHTDDAIWQKITAPGNSESLSSTIINITSDGRDSVFAVDGQGILNFLTEERKWWEVNVSEYIDEDQHLLSHYVVQSLPSSVATSVHKVQRWMTGLIRGQFVAANNQSVWVVQESKAMIARGPLTGHRWELLTPLGVTKSSKWTHIATSSRFSPDLGSWTALVWASRPNGEIFCFSSQDAMTAYPVALPPPVLGSSSIVCMSACKEALWVLYDNGEIYIRSGITTSCLQGTDWSHLDTKEQLGEVKIVHVSCGTQNTWAVDSHGEVFFRFGVGAVDSSSLPPAWIPLGGCNVPGHVFTQIECGLSDSSIWAIDNCSEVYIRTGVSVNMPVGEEWELVPGSHARQICISNHTVWGLRIGGNLIKRFGISDRNQMGNYWKKVRGKFNRIAATPYDELWAIDQQEHLRHLRTTVFCPLVVEAQYQYDETDDFVPDDFSPPVNTDKEWEFL